MSITVYGREVGCVQCDATKRRLNKLEIPYTFVDVSANERAYAQVASWGYQQVPVVHVKTSTGEHHWAGYRPDLLNGLVAERDK